MKRILRPLSPLIALVIAASVAVPLAAATAADNDGTSESKSGDNIAIAVNTEDGTIVFEVAFSVRRVNNGVVDNTNIAAALASCTDCTTVAIAFQAVLVTRDPDILIPQNLALAFNDHCTGCVTYASATQLVFGYSGQVRITGDGRQRLHALRDRLLDLQERAADLTLSELIAEVDAAEREMLAIFTDEIVELGPTPEVADDAESVTPSLTDPTTTLPATSLIGSVEPIPTTAAISTDVPEEGSSVPDEVSSVPTLPDPPPESVDSTMPTESSVPDATLPPPEPSSTTLATLPPETVPPETVPPETVPPETVATSETAVTASSEPPVTESP